MKKVDIPFDGTTLFRRIKELRGSRSLEGYANEYNISHSTLRNYETSRVPPFEFLYAMHKKEEVSLDWLVGDEKDYGLSERQQELLDLDSNADKGMQTCVKYLYQRAQQRKKQRRKANKPVPVNLRSGNDRRARVSV